MTMTQMTNKPNVQDLPAEEQIARLIGRLRAAVTVISGKSPTTARMVLDRYYRFMAPGMAYNADAMTFPSPVRRHPQFPEKGTVGGKFNLVCFYIGNSLLAYYESVKTGRVAPELARRVRMCELIAENGLVNFKIIGSVQEGLSLEHPMANRVLAKLDNPNALPPSTKV